MSLVDDCRSPGRLTAVLPCALLFFGAHVASAQTEKPRSERAPAPSSVFQQAPSVEKIPPPTSSAASVEIVAFEFTRDGAIPVVRVRLRNLADEGVIGFEFEIRGSDPNGWSGQGSHAGTDGTTPPQAVIEPRGEHVVDLDLRNFEKGDTLRLAAVLFASGRGEGDSARVEQMRQEVATVEPPEAGISEASITPIRKRDEMKDAPNAVLAAQPDYAADLVVTGLPGGERVAGRIARKKHGVRFDAFGASPHGGAASGSPSVDAVLLLRADQPAVTLIPELNAYVEAPGDFAQARAIALPGIGIVFNAFLVEDLLNTPDRTFTVVGEETVEGHECVVFEGSGGGGRAAGPRLYAAKDLNGLVIKIADVGAGDGGAGLLLRKVSLDVPESLLSIPPGYRKHDLTAKP